LGRGRVHCTHDCIRRAAVRGKVHGNMGGGGLGRKGDADQEGEEPQAEGQRRSVSRSPSVSPMRGGTFAAARGV
jgi:hypothetical protein